MTHTLKITNPLFLKVLKAPGASVSIFQYGFELVQKFASLLASLPPRGVSTGTERLNTPLSRYNVQRETISLRLTKPLSATVVTSSGKKEGSTKTEKASRKSGGVTSDTNQGINLGLRWVPYVKDEPLERSNHLLENDFGNVWSVCHEEIGEDQVGK